MVFFLKCYGVIRNNENVNVKYPGLSKGLNFEQNAAERAEIQTNSGYMLISKCRYQKAETGGVCHTI